MEKKASLSPRLSFAGACACAVAANEIAFQVVGKPVIYCALAPMTATLYLHLATMALYAVAAYAVLKLFQGQIIPAVGGAAIIFGIVELPQFLTNTIGHGGFCG